jgi:hypothetical protein
MKLMLVYIDVSKPGIEFGGCLDEYTDCLEVIAVDSALLLRIESNCCEETTPLYNFSCC